MSIKTPVTVEHNPYLDESYLYDADGTECARTYSDDHAETAQRIADALNAPRVPDGVTRIDVTDTTPCPISTDIGWCSWNDDWCVLYEYELHDYDATCKRIRRDYGQIRDCPALHGVFVSAGKGE